MGAMHDKSIETTATIVEEETPEVSREEIASRLRDPQFTLIDVLPAASYSVEHIPGALSMPLEILKQRVSEQYLDLGRELNVYCATFT